jgi:hypothetical protein
MHSETASGPAIGRIGLWRMELRGSDKPEIHDIAAALDDEGWKAFWIAGANGPGLWTDAEDLLSSAPRASVALGVMSIWSTDARIAAEQHRRLTATYGKRLIVGLGVSSPESAAAVGQPAPPRLRRRRPDAGRKRSTHRRHRRLGLPRRHQPSCARALGGRGRSCRPAGIVCRSRTPACGVARTQRAPSDLDGITRHNPRSAPSQALSESAE